MVKTVLDDSYYVTIYVAGDVNEIKKICAHYCYEVGLCVTVTETEFIYTGGRELGAAIGLVNYPKFPKSPHDICLQAYSLANRLIKGLAQETALIQTPKEVAWITRRKEDCE